MKSITTLRKADIEEYEKILEFYQNVINSIKNSAFKPKWSKDYPNLEYIEKSIENGEMFVCSQNNSIIACAVLNNHFDPEYVGIRWISNAQPAEITVIHTFAVDSSFTGKGIGKKIFNQIRKNAIENNKKSIRVDIIDGNNAARKVFEKFGFKYVETIEVFHRAVGLEKFHLYELVLDDKNFEI